MEAEGIKILYIDDNPDDVDLIRGLLGLSEKSEFDLESVERLSDGLARLERGGIDLILLDLSLPDSQGFETFSVLKERSKAVPILVMTGLNDDELAVRAVKGGAQDYLVKGLLNANSLTRVIRYAVERGKLITKLKEALEQIKTLRGFIPICASCKNIRDDQGFWQQVEVYVRDRSEAEFSHSLCPRCARKLYPEFADLVDPDNANGCGTS